MFDSIPFFHSLDGDRTQGEAGRSTAKQKFADEIIFYLIVIFQNLYPKTRYDIFICVYYFGLLTLRL